MWPNETAYDALIGPLTQRAGIDPALVKAIIGHESGFNPTAYHFDGPDPALDASYGLMQVEGVTARGYGFTGPLPGLYDPATNLRYGVQRLAEALTRHGGDIPSALSDYNGGDRPELGYGTPLPGGRFGNQAYVDSVLANLAYFRAQTPAPSATTGASGLSTPELAVLIVGGGLALAGLAAAVLS